MLCDHDFLWQDPQDEHYRLGALAVRVGQRAVTQRDLRRIAWPILNELAADIGETVILATLNAARDQAVYVEQIESRKGVRLVPQIGVQLPLHAGGTAKAILVYLDEAEIDRVLTLPLLQLTRGTMTDPEACEPKSRRSGAVVTLCPLKRPMTPPPAWLSPFSITTEVSSPALALPGRLPACNQPTNWRTR